MDDMKVESELAITLRGPSVQINNTLRELMAVLTNEQQVQWVWENIERTR